MQGENAAISFVHSEGVVEFLKGMFKGSKRAVEPEEFVVEEEAKTYEERRKHVRVKMGYDSARRVSAGVAAWGVFQDNRRVRSRIFNLSLGGMLLEVPRQVAKGDEFICLVEGAKNVSAFGGSMAITNDVKMPVIVSWVRPKSQKPAGYWVGAQFKREKNPLRDSWVISVCESKGCIQQVERRQLIRVPSNAAMVFKTRDDFRGKGQIHNIGLGGFYASVRIDLRHGTKIIAGIQSTDGGPVVHEIRGEVLRAKAKGSILEIGVQFEKLSDDAIKELETLVDFYRPPREMQF